MNINSFIHVIEIDRCGSINRAAQNLYLSQSNLSSGLKALEEELGYQLFVRSPSGISLTPEGRYFLQSAKAIQVELDKIKHIPEMVNVLSTISLSCTWSSLLLQKFLSFKNTNQPQTQDTFKETGLMQTFQDVQENRYRLSLFYCFHSRLPIHTAEAEKTNLSTSVITSHIPAVALVSREHPLAGQKTVTLADLHRYPLALFEDFSDEDWIHILRVPSYQRLLYLFDRGAIKDAVMHGGYISVTKQGAVYDSSIDQMLELPIRDLEDDLDLVLLKRRTYELNRREKAFLNYLRDQLTFKRNRR